MVVGDQFELCKAALIFAVTRWILSFALNLFTPMGLFSASSYSSSSTYSTTSSSSSPVNLKMVKESLNLTTLENIEHRLPENYDRSCAVCLNNLRKKSQVWELKNCCHVFHKNCLERWLSYDHQLTCPLCRASLLPVSHLPATSQPQPPSWAVERMLYLFGDDLLH